MKDRDRLWHILEAIERIEKYLVYGEEQFRQSELIQTWIVHHLQIIGEAVRMLSKSFRDAHPEVEWNKIIGMRNILVHEYFGIDSDIVWRVVNTELPNLKKKVKTFIQEVSESKDGE
ncbi:HepT-like ribonuclease domain-containing protein [Calditerricola satsumensis]|uniref:DUF86 domain-containing protein n=1 Tax=Calditerricola satsumensis TaxID=373054 RepID=A0A8J3B4Z2_9BACI|nr:DUF86 domain-containing protein [Calditerricola satsumensis]GGJ95988.1 DUF86 domain-containing protein [Calditerricola satsumensis]